MKKKELDDFLYSTSDVLDTLEAKLSNLADIVELMAGHETTNHVSGALWFIRDNMKEIAEKIELISNNIMDERLEK